MSDRGAATAPASFWGVRRLTGAGAGIAFGRRRRHAVVDALVRLGIGVALTAPAAAQPPSTRSDYAAEKAERDSASVLFADVVRLAGPVPITDVAFASVGRNIVTPVDIAWVVGGQPAELVAFAARPIPGTATAGEELGRSGRAQLQAPVALFATPDGSSVLERDGRLVSLASGNVDTLQLALGGQPAIDLAIATSGLVHVLTAVDVRIWPPGLGGAPVWTIALPPAAQPVTSLAVSARGEVYVAGGGKNVLTVFDLDATGNYRVVRSRTATQVGCKRASGIALLAAMLLPIPGREGWVGEHRYAMLSDPDARALIVVDAATLKTVGKAPLATEQADLAPGRLDVSNRGQVAVVDASGKGAFTLPTRVLAAALDKAPIRWRRIGPADSTAAVAPQRGGGP